jgi:hypothetical protein
VEGQTQGVDEAERLSPKELESCSEHALKRKSSLNGRDALDRPALSFEAHSIQKRQHVSCFSEGTNENGMEGVAVGAVSMGGVDEEDGSDLELQVFDYFGNSIAK